MPKPKIGEIYENAVRHHKSGQLPQAEQLYRDVLAREPNHAPALHFLGVLAHQAGQHDAAAKLIERALVLQPNYAEAHSNLGLALMSLQRDGDAAQHFRSAIRLLPNYAEAHYNLGIAEDALGLPAEALDCYTTALTLKPDYLDAHCNRAIALHALGRAAEAAEAYDGVIRSAPHLTRLLTYHGVALLESGAGHEGVAALQRAVLAAPDDPVPHFYLGEVAANGGDFITAAAQIFTALTKLIATGVLTLADVPQPKSAASSGLFPEALRAAMRCMNAAGIEVFLTAGTLLGAIRDGDFLSFDKDIDLGVSSTVAWADIAKAFAADPDFTTNWTPGGDGILYYWQWRHRIAIDFFHFFEEDNCVWYGLYRGGRLMKWLHRPFELTDMAWHGMTVRIPEDSRYFLEEVYGPGWRIPDPDCAQWACPNIEGGFPLNCRYYAYVDIFLAIWRGYKSRAHHQCRQALELAAGDKDLADLLASFDRATESGRQRPPLSASDRMIAGRMAESAGREAASALTGKDEPRLRLLKNAC